MNYIFLLPLIAALIGYITNYLAVKMLFHPKNPISFLGFKIQGIFPKRQKAIAESIGKLVESKLISTDVIADNIDVNHVKVQIRDIFSSKIEAFLQEVLPQKFPMVSMFLDKNTLDSIGNFMIEEIASSVDNDVKKIGASFISNIDIEKIVQEKVINFSMTELEDMLYSILSKEFRFIEWVGAVLGFIIGFVQVGLLYFN